MPVILPRENINDVYGSLGDLSPSGEEKSAARFSILGEALENLSTSVLAVSAARSFFDSRDDTRITAERSQQIASSFGVDNLKGVGEGGISPRALNLILARQVKKRDRARNIEAARIGGIEQFGLALLGSAADPINLVSFGVGGRVRGAGLAASAAKGAAVGAGVTAAVEPLFFTLSRFSGDDYRVRDSITNIVLGGALGSGFHLAGHTIGNFKERKAVARLVNEQAANDLPIEVGPALKTYLNDIDGQRIVDINVDSPNSVRPSTERLTDPLNSEDVEARTPVEEATLRQSADETRGVEQQTVRGPAAYSKNALDELNSTRENKDAEPRKISLPVAERQTKDLAELQELLDNDLSALPEDSAKDVVAEINKQFEDSDTLTEGVIAALRCGLKKGSPDGV